MNRTVQLGDYIHSQLADASDALVLAETDLPAGVSAARTSIRSARAVMRLLEPGNKRFRELNDALGIGASRLGPIRDSCVKLAVPPPLGPSLRAELTATASDVAIAQAELPELLDGLKIPKAEIIGAAGRTFRQARRRFLRALPEEDDEPFDIESLNKCRKATQRVHLQSEALLGGAHTKRSAKFGELGQLIWDHRDARVLGTDDPSLLIRLESQITKLGLDLFSRKPSAHREWLAEKLAASTGS